MKRVAAAACFLSLLQAEAPAESGRRSLTDFEPGAPGAGVEIPGPDTNDVAELKERLVLSQAAIRNLSESLAVSNMQGEVFKRQLQEFQLRLEGIGLAGLENDPSGLEARLLQAIRELRVLKEQNQEASRQLVSLTEAVQVLVQSAEKLNPQARMSVETELRKTSEILGAANAPEAGAAPSGLGDAMVLEFKPDLSLIVANVGKVHGVKVGMPFRIIRDGRQIGSAKAVDVRERISGAVVQDLASEIPEVGKGDLLQVDAR
jgi:hypothetical protein